VFRVARTVEELIGGSDEPRCLFGARFAFWAVDRDLGGHGAWGFADRRDTEAYVAVLEAALDHRPRHLLVDWSGIQGATEESFAVLQNYFKRNGPRIVPASAIVPPQGMLGAVVAGFYDVATEHTRPPLVRSLAEACELIGRTDALGAIEALETLRRGRAEGHAVVDRLRELLSSETPPDSLTAAADRLGQPARTLQHRLRKAGTSFRDEHDRTRLRRACSLLRGSVKVAAIAAEVGFSSAQHFASWFKKQTGATPAEWRADNSG
jgi:AraC-like DNA-binding protein